MVHAWTGSQMKLRSEAVALASDDGIPTAINSRVESVAVCAAQVARPMCVPASP
jgi:hypothetical protein